MASFGAETIVSRFSKVLSKAVAIEVRNFFSNIIRRRLFFLYMSWQKIDWPIGFQRDHVIRFGSELLHRTERNAAALKVLEEPHDIVPIAVGHGIPGYYQ